MSLAHRIGHEGACAQAKDIPRLRARANAIVNANRVPPALQEPLLSAVAALEEQTPLCIPSAPPPAPVGTPVITPAPPAHPQPHGPKKHGHGHGHGHGDEGD